jgi:hypothetical protein
MRTKPMHLDTKFFNYLGHNQNPAQIPEDAFGVEVELEGRNIITDDPRILKLWGAHRDGSLRVVNPGDQSTEYTFNGAYDLKTTENAINLLFDYLTGPNARVNESYRTSIHVHVNCMNETYRTIYNYITLAIILDELLVSQNGDHRIGNNFCLRAKDAEGQIDALIGSIDGFGDAFHGLGENHRYSSTNLASLTKFGTVEFRSLECTMDRDRLMHWIKTLQTIKESARRYTNPKEVIGLFSKLGPRLFLGTILGPQAAKYVAVPNFDKMLINGMRLAQDFAYCAEWKAYKVGEPQVKELKKMPAGGGHEFAGQELEFLREQAGRLAPQPLNRRPGGIQFGDAQALAGWGERPARPAPAPRRRNRDGQFAAMAEAAEAVPVPDPRQAPQPDVNPAQDAMARWIRIQEADLANQRRMEAAQNMMGGNWVAQGQHVQVPLPNNNEEDF